MSILFFINKRFYFLSKSIMSYKTFYFLSILSIVMLFIVQFVNDIDMFLACVFSMSLEMSTFSLFVFIVSIFTAFVSLMEFVICW